MRSRSAGSQPPAQHCATPATAADTTAALTASQPAVAAASIEAPASMASSAGSPSGA